MNTETFEWFYHYGQYCFVEEYALWELTEWWYDPMRHEVTHIEYDTFADRAYETTINAELRGTVPEPHIPAFRKLLTVLATIYP